MIWSNMGFIIEKLFALHYFKMQNLQMYMFVATNYMGFTTYCFIVVQVIYITEFFTANITNLKEMHRMGRNICNKFRENKLCYENMLLP